MDVERLSQLVTRLRQLGTDDRYVEVKAAGGGLPRNVMDSVSAFSNGHGGVIVLGLAEEDGFRLAPSFDAVAIRDALAQACADKLDPPVRAPVEIFPLDSGQVVVLEVPECDPAAKPVYIKTAGPMQGSYIRSGDGDRHLTQYEVALLMANRAQPRHDVVAVEQADIDALDESLVAGLLHRVGRRAPRAMAGLDNLQALTALGAVADVDGSPHPTLAGLVALGRFPQQFFPQLFISVVALPGTTMGESLRDGTRFLDNVTCDGPVPWMIEDAVQAVVRNMRSRSVVSGISRRDVTDYPLGVVRELIVNAVMHRDYSPESLGTQVQVELYADRLVVRSPGGLYGPLTIDQLGVDHVSSSRNATLAKLLGDLTMEGSNSFVAENRGSGLRQVSTQLRDVGMSPPAFDVAPAVMTVVVPQMALQDQETQAWLAQIPGGVTTPEGLALAMMRHDGVVTNEMLRLWGVERSVATVTLASLVARGLATREGGRRHARYRLTVSQRPSPFSVTGPNNPSGSRGVRATVNEPATAMDPSLTAVIEAIRTGKTRSREISEALGLTYDTTLRRLRKLKELGLIEETQASRSTKQSYRLR